jgi:hypothetical protein
MTELTCDSLRRAKMMSAMGGHIGSSLSLFHSHFRMTSVPTMTSGLITGGYYTQRHSRG